MTTAPLVISSQAAGEATNRSRKFYRTGVSLFSAGQQQYPFGRKARKTLPIAAITGLVGKLLIFGYLTSKN